MPTKIEWATETWNPITGCTPMKEWLKWMNIIFMMIRSCLLNN